MSSKKLWNSMRFVVACALILIAFGSASTQAHADTAPTGLSDPAELETFLDSMIPAQLKNKHIAGAAVVVVKDGEIFFAKGYGYADVEKQIPVNPDTTVFNVGSVAKLFTWTAVMQLAEQGKLDLDTDINQYLDFKIPDTYPEPITLKHLLTHTPGFENTPFGIAAADPKDLVPNAIWLKDNIPARMWPPGQIPSYSNYGTGLAGYIVERVSGMPYQAYVEQHILTPLEMERSTLQQPVPPELAADQARGYNYFEDAFQPQSPEYINVVPAGGLQASATDMARFMIAHLQNGRYCPPGCAGGEARILGESTAQQMRTQLWTADERLNGLAHGFVEMSQNGYHVVGHAGDTSLFHSLMALLPEENVGIFLSFNSMASSGVPYTLLEAFMDRYYPDTSPASPAPLPDFATRSARYTGNYQMVRLGYSGGGKILGLLAAFSVDVNDAGELEVNHPLGGVRRYIEVAPFYFEQVDGDGRILLREDNLENVTYLHLSDLPQIALKKVAWYETRLFNLGLIAVVTLLFLSFLVVGLVRLVIRLFRRREQPVQPILARLAPALMVLMALVGLALMVGLFLVVTDSWALASGQRDILTIIGGLSLVAALLTVSTVVLAILAWRAKWWRAPARVHYTLVALGSLALVWFLIFWNQLGWQWW